jgi:pyruvate ferredoxin oxidoreductase gamma subunit
MAVVDATEIAMKHLGRPITNTTMLGALIKATGIVDIKSMKKPLKGRFGRIAEINTHAMQQAYKQTQ